MAYSVCCRFMLCYSRFIHTPRLISLLIVPGREARKAQFNQKFSIPDRPGTWWWNVLSYTSVFLWAGL
jgi:hypothetical protein